jgi:hypothetical protein
LHSENRLHVDISTLKTITKNYETPSISLYFLNN